MIDMRHVVVTDDSGLDAFAADSVMAVLHELAISKRKTIVASIHQPRQSIVDQGIDCLVLLSQGRTMYRGPPTHEALQWFEGRGGLVCPPKISPTGRSDKLVTCIRALA